MKKKLVLILLGAVLGIAILPYLVIRQPDLPSGTSLRSPAFPYAEAELLIDRTLHPEDAEAPVTEHEIFDTLLAEIAGAETYLIVDFFLWNPWTGALESDRELRPLASQLAQALILKRQRDPAMPILVVTDPLNRVYGRDAPEFYGRLAEAGIPVVFTDLGRLPDSNRIYGPQARFWGKFFQPGASADAKGRVPNPFDPEGESMSLAQLGRLLYFKANHRKVLVAGRADLRDRLIVGSFNPADGSANHSNLAVRVDGPVAHYAARSEIAVASWSAEAPDRVMGDRSVLEATLADLRALIPEPVTAEPPEGAATVTYLSEGKIQAALVEILEGAGEGARVDIGMFYFSDRKVVRALKGAIRRGAAVRALLDANRDAFGREKNGVPNRPVAAELMKLSGAHGIEVRWAATEGEQFHGKVLRIEGPDTELLLLGSANWTRRNLADLNLEANLLFRDAPELGTEFDAYFDDVWTNGRGITESLPYVERAESGWSLRWKTWLYRFQEWSGASTF